MPDAAARLRASVPSNVTVLLLAVSDKAGRSTLYLPRMGRVAVDTRATLEATANPGFDAIEIDTKRIDDLALENIAFMKIDVEGHEQAVLRGARDLIASSRPTLLIESEERHGKEGWVRRRPFSTSSGTRAFSSIPVGSDEWPPSIRRCISDTSMPNGSMKVGRPNI
jgi:FkbM family methyltransferase